MQYSTFGFMELFNGLANISKVVLKHACIAEAICDCPLIGYFGYYALWIQPLCAWMVSLHEVCEIRYEVG